MGSVNCREFTSSSNKRDGNVISTASNRIERTFIMIKPDGVERNLIGNIILRFEHSDFQLIAMKFLIPPISLVEEHYADHKNCDYFKPLVRYICSGPVIPMCWKGENIIEISRNIIGGTNTTGTAGTIRGDYGNHHRYNLVHGSDSNESAEKEIKIWFNQSEIIE